MAWRFSAANQRIYMPGWTGNVATVLCWFSRVADRNAFSNPWVTYSGSTGGGTLNSGFGSDSGGDSFVLFDSAFTSMAGPASVTNGTWYCMAAVLNNTTWTLYHGTSVGSLTTVGPSTRAALTTPGSISLSDPADWFSGDLANLKVFTRALSLAEVQAELATYAEVSTTNLFRRHTMQTVTMVPDSGVTNATAGAGAVSAVSGPATLDALSGGGTSATTISATATARLSGSGTSATTIAATAAARAAGSASSATTVSATAAARALGTGTSATTISATAAARLTGVGGTVTTIAATATARANGTATSATTIGATAAGSSAQAIGGGTSSTTIAATATARANGVAQASITTISATATASGTVGASAVTVIVATATAHDLTPPLIPGGPHAGPAAMGGTRRAGAVAMLAGGLRAGAAA